MMLISKYQLIQIKKINKKLLIINKYQDSLNQQRVLKYKKIKRQNKKCNNKKDKIKKISISK